MAQASCFHSELTEGSDFVILNHVLAQLRVSFIIRLERLRSAYPKVDADAAAAQ